MRSIKELLEVMLENQDLFDVGLCSWAWNLRHRDKIDDAAISILLRYIKHNRPSPYSSLDAWLNSDSAFYWKKGKITPRIKWIKKHIKLNSKK